MNVNNIKLFYLLVQVRFHLCSFCFNLMLICFKQCDLASRNLAYSFDPLKPHFYTVKLGFTGVCINFLISAQRHSLWVLVRAASQRRFQQVPTIYVLSRNMKTTCTFYMKVFVMTVYYAHFVDSTFRTLCGLVAPRSGFSFFFSVLFIVLTFSFFFFFFFFFFWSCPSLLSPR